MCFIFFPILRASWKLTLASLLGILSYTKVIFLEALLNNGVLSKCVYFLFVESRALRGEGSQRTHPAS